MHEKPTIPQVRVCFLVALFASSLSACGDDLGLGQQAYVPPTSVGGGAADASIGTASPKDAGSDGALDAGGDAKKDTAVAKDGGTDAPAISMGGAGISGAAGKGGAGMGGAGSSAAGMGAAGTTGTAGMGGPVPKYDAAKCAACRQTNCAADPDAAKAIKDCATDDALMDKGPGAGKKRKELCQAVETCIRTSRCLNETNEDPAICYCGTVGETVCLTAAAGSCKKEIENGQEEDNPAGEISGELIVGRLQDPTIPTGQALYQATQCDLIFCRADCLALPPLQGSGGSSGSAGSGGTTGSPGSAGQTGGSGGGGMGGAAAGSSGGGGVSGAGGRGGSEGGGGTGGSGGTAGSGAGGAGTPPTGKPTAACLACGAASCDEGSRGCAVDAMGTAAAGPAAGKPRKELCEAVVSCVNLHKECLGSKGDDPAPCFCGTANETECQMGKANGPCKAEIEAAGESTDGMQIAGTFFSPDSAMGLALSFVVGCQNGDACKAECAKPEVPSGGAGQSGSAGQTGSAGESGAAGQSGAGGTSNPTPDAGAAPDAPSSPDVPNGGCADLDRNRVPDCTESLVKNSDFDANLDQWKTDISAEAAWVFDDAGNDAMSGSASIKNTAVFNIGGITMAGITQCIPVTAGKTYRALAQVLVKSATAVIQLREYASSDCTGDVLPDAVTSPAAAVATTWKQVEAKKTAQALANSMVVHLASIKPFMDPASSVLFDDVLVKVVP